jgi:Meiotically up-regulated gene 113
MTHSQHDEPGYIYLIEAIGYHGIASPFLKRCKIGLSRNPEARRQNFVKSQFPCDVKLLKTIYVEDMAEVESKLHQQFDFCNVTLEKSREWFDLNPVQYLRVRLALKMHQVYVFSFHELPLKTIVSSAGLIFIIGVLLGGVGVKVGGDYLQSTTQATPVKHTK